MRKFVRKLAALSIAASLALSCASMPTAEAETSVSSLTLQPGVTQSSLNVTWYAEGSLDSVKAQVEMGGRIYSAKVSATTAPTGAENPYNGYVVCKAEIDGLAPDTEYTYRLSSDNGATWSEEYAYKTPAEDHFRFGFTSDPQIKESGEIDPKGWNPSDATNQTGWKAMMKVLADSGVTLIVSAGDQVEDQSWGKKSEYDAFFAPKEMASIAYAPAVGNHDRHYMFKDHFDLPNETYDELTEVKTTFRGQNSGTSLSHGNYVTATDEEIASSKAEKGIAPNSDGIYDYAERREMETRGNYYYLYDNVLFVTLNTGAYPGGNDALEGENPEAESANKENEAVGIIDNFRKTLASATNDYAGEYDWLIVTHHKSTQTVAKHAADSDIENYVDAGFEQLMEDFGVDFVLGGHDHVYSRSFVLNGSGERVSERLDRINDPEGTIYLTGNCASDMQYYTPFAALDKSNNADYPRLANGERGSAAYMKGQNAENPKDYLPIGNQEYNQEYSPCYVVFDVDGRTISAKAYNLDGDGALPSSKLIDSFTVTKGLDGGEQRVGFENGAGLDMRQLARYDSGMEDADGGVMEIVDYCPENGWAYAVNGKAGILTAIPMKDLGGSDKIKLLDGYDIDIRALVSGEDFVYGDMTSVAVSPDGKTLAAALQAEGYNENGRAAIFDINADGTITLIASVKTGVQPDMVTFTPDGRYILTADEGEPREGYEATAVDPEGSVTLIDTASLESTVIGFEDFEHEALAADGVIIKKGSSPAADLEPEYIAAANDKAYVTLQEANAVAVLDIEKKSFTGVYSLGGVDYDTIAIDLDKGDGKYFADNYKNTVGLRMPDGIAVFEAGGRRYIVTANEGDSREWGEYTNEDSEKLTSASGTKTDKKVTFFNSGDYDGLDDGKTYLFGSRGFSVFDVTDGELELVFDSGSDFEQKSAEYLPEYFNCSNDSLDIDDRSNKKGPEPESAAVGVVGDRTYAFIGLERIGGVMVYDVTDPKDGKFVNYINSRDFSNAIGADNSPEGLKFISAEESSTGKALLLAACEVGGTMAVYELSESEIEITGFEYDDERQILTADILAPFGSEKKIIAAFYNEDTLIKAVFGTREYGEAESRKVEFDLSSLPSGSYDFKLMMWDSFSALSPAAEVYMGRLVK